MALLDDLNDPNQLQSKLRGRCQVCELLLNLDKDTSKRLQQLLDDPAVVKARLAAILSSNGYKIHQNTISRHARKECFGSAR